MDSVKELINCLYCNESKSVPWATENGYVAVKCSNCGLIYVNPRPSMAQINDAVETGVHTDVDHGRTAIGRRLGSKVYHYRKIFNHTFRDVWERTTPISWLDVGTGYGEVIEAVSELAPVGSRIVGLEPMKPKAEYARKRGLTIEDAYLNQVHEKFGFVSMINVFSHIPDFRLILNDAKKVLLPGGEILIETGNTADLKNRNEVPGELDLPDHLVFAGERHLSGYLTQAGFSVISIQRNRVDGLMKLVKNIAKKALGRKDVTLTIPYTSSYRSLLVRGRLNG